MNYTWSNYVDEGKVKYRLVSVTDADRRSKLHEHAVYDSVKHTYVRCKHAFLCGFVSIYFVLFYVQLNVSLEPNSPKIITCVKLSLVIIKQL